MFIYDLYELYKSSFFKQCSNQNLFFSLSNQIQIFKQYCIMKDVEHIAIHFVRTILILF